jgi:DNA polymerase III epsilon subunit family exonuclease
MCYEIESGHEFHRYMNPERDVDLVEIDKHGITLEFLKDEPLFKDIADELLEYLEGADLIGDQINNDIQFLNSELCRVGKAPLDRGRRIVDIREVARECFPNMRNDINALMERFNYITSVPRCCNALQTVTTINNIYRDLLLFKKNGAKKYAYVDYPWRQPRCIFLDSAGSFFENHKEYTEIKLACKFFDFNVFINSNGSGDENKMNDVYTIDIKAQLFNYFGDESISLNFTFGTNKFDWVNMQSKIKTIIKDGNVTLVESSAYYFADEDADGRIVLYNPTIEVLGDRFNSLITAPEMDSGNDK